MHYNNQTAIMLKCDQNDFSINEYNNILQTRPKLHPFMLDFKYLAKIARMRLRTDCMQTN